MPYELIPMACAAGLTVAFAISAIGRAASGKLLVGACLTLFAALTLLGSMALHSGEILINQINGVEVGMYKRAADAPHAKILGFTYDFRFYSLQLFGAVLIWWSSQLARSAVRLTKGEPGAVPCARRNILRIFLLVAPLIPMHVFAVATAVLMGIGCLGLILARVHMPPVDRPASADLVTAAAAR